MLRKFIGSARAAALMVKALDQRAHKKYEEAWSSLTKIYQVLGGEMPSKVATMDMNILCSIVASKLGRYTLSIEAAKVALAQIERVRYLSEDDKNYLRYYCKRILEFCEGELGLQTYPDSRSIGVTFSSLHFDRVKAGIKANFIMTKPVASEQTAPG